MKRDSRNRVNTAILGILLFALIAGTITGCSSNNESAANDEQSLGTDDIGLDTPSVMPEGIGYESEYQILPDENGNPVAQVDVKFDELKTLNDDVYAWIYIPGTEINCAVVCNADDPDYYLQNEIANVEGVFTQNYNSTDFSDRMTVVYGKSVNGKNPFSDIHKFADKAFFDSNKYIYVCTKERIFTYRIFAAHKAYAEHLVLGYDFTQDGIFLDYLSHVIEGDDEVDSKANIDEDTVLVPDDRIVTLSDKIEGEPDYRYLVQGVLISESEKEK